MGCDGGTIPKRKEIVKNKERRPRQQRDRGASAAEEWKSCVICDWTLTKPIVAGQWGHIFSKECVLKHLIDYGRGALSAYHLVGDKSPKLDSLHAMKDVKELKLKENSLVDGSSQSSNSEEDAIRADFVCPITGLETNGKYKFVFSWKCGCVVSERAIKEVPNDDKCLVCQEPYKKFDIVTLNPDKKDLEENQAKFLVRQLSDHLSKDELTTDHDDSHSSRDNGGWEDDDDDGGWGLDDDGNWGGRGGGGGFVPPRPKGPSAYALLRQKRQQRQKERQRLQRRRPQEGPVDGNEPSTSTGSRSSRSTGSKTSRHQVNTSGGHDRRRPHDDSDVSSTTSSQSSKKQRP